MKKIVFIMCFVTVLISCSEDNVSEDIFLEEKTLQSSSKKDDLMFAGDENSCDDKVSIYPSGNGNTGSFVITTTLPYFYGPIDQFSTCDKITFTGKYDKDLNKLSEIKASYYKGWLYSLGIRHKYSIAQNDIFWLTRNNQNEFRLVFRMDKIIQNINIGYIDPWSYVQHRSDNGDIYNHYSGINDPGSQTIYYTEKQIKGVEDGTYSNNLETRTEGKYINFSI